MHARYITLSRSFVDARNPARFEDAESNKIKFICVSLNSAFPLDFPIYFSLSTKTYLNFSVL